MPLSLAFALMALSGALVAGGALLGMRLIGAQVRLARRLAGARQLSVAEVMALAAQPPRAVRVSGRVRTPDPIIGPDDEPLVALHRDVAVWQPGAGWRTIERLRLTRSFELWDHAGSFSIDPAEAAEPLVSIPLVWEGSVDELGEPHAAAVARLSADAAVPTMARSVTRTIGVADRLLVLANARIGSDGIRWLAPPPGGYLVTSLELDEAMRLLGGRRRGLLATAIVVLGAGVAVLIAGSAAAIVSALLGT